MLNIFYELNVMVSESGLSRFPSIYSADSMICWVILLDFRYFPNPAWYETNNTADDYLAFKVRCDQPY